MNALTLKEFSLRLRRNSKFPDDDELAVFDFLMRLESEGWSWRIDDPTLMVNCWVYRFDKNQLHALIDSFIDANEDHLRELWRTRPHAVQPLRVSWVEGEDTASVLGRSESVRLPMPAYVTVTDHLSHRRI
jgi:hypothetical protein